MHDLLPIAKRLKAARAAKGLSQRALAEQAGVPQSHISRIENGAVDLQTSSLIQLARALDLEVALVPRKLSLAVQSLQRESAPIPTVLETARYIHGLLARIARMKKRFATDKSLQALERAVRHVGRMTYGPSIAKQAVTLFDNAEKLLEKVEDLTAKQISKEYREYISGIAREIRNLDEEPISAVPPRPAYVLGEDSDDA